MTYVTSVSLIVVS